MSSEGDSSCMQRLPPHLAQTGIASVLVLLCLAFFSYDSLSLAGQPIIHAPQRGFECSSKEGMHHVIESSSAKCMDGSPPAYYFRPSAGASDASNENSTKWHVHFEGGGWCYDLETCYSRTFGRLGSTKHDPHCFELQDYLSNDESENPLMYGWNHVSVRYCDSASYAGDAVQYFEVPYLPVALLPNACSTHALQGHRMFFYGRNNRDETIAHLLRHRGMSAATDVVISGCSAGGLGIYLGIDQIAAQVLADAPNARVSALSDSGFFPDYTSDERWQSEHEYPEAIIDGRMDYSRCMKNLFLFANMSAGAHPKCLAAYANQPEMCVFAENLIPHIETPLFALQPQHDHWQIWHIVGKPFDYPLINEFGKSLTTKLREVLLSRKHNGALIDSCIHHCTKCSSDLRSWSHTPEASEFTLWYQGDAESRLTGMLVIQDEPYPCLHCCTCTI